MKLSTIRCLMVQVVVVVLVAGCGELPLPVPSIEQPTALPSGVIPSLPPRSSVSPSPEPRDTFTPDQQAAADTVVKFFEIFNEVHSDPNAPAQPLADITIGQSQTIQINRLRENREADFIQTGEVVVTITGATNSPSLDESQTVTIEACTDSTGMDLISQETGESVLLSTHPYYISWQIQVVHVQDRWRVGDITNQEVESCVL